jgi:hypothetical protein
MFECFRRSVSYEKPTNLAHVRVSISEDTVEQVPPASARPRGSVAAARA